MRWIKPPNLLTTNRVSKIRSIPSKRPSRLWILPQTKQRNLMRTRRHKLSAESSFYAGSHWMTIGPSFGAGQDSRGRTCLEHVALATHRSLTSCCWPLYQLYHAECAHKWLLIWSRKRRCQPKIKNDPFLNYNQQYNKYGHRVPDRRHW